MDETKDTALGFMRYFLSARADALLSSIGEADEPPPLTPPETESSTETKPSESTSDISSSPEEPTEKPTEPPQAEIPEDSHENCTAGGFATFWNAIVNFFRRLFGKPEICVCGKEI